MPYAPQKSPARFLFANCSWWSFLPKNRNGSVLNTGSWTELSCPYPRAAPVASSGLDHDHPHVDLARDALGPVLVVAG